MKTIRSWNSFRAALFLAAVAILGVASAFAQSGGVVLGHSIIEPAFDDMTGNPVFILETQKSPFPSASSPTAAAPLYAVLYPVQSSVPANMLDCQPTTCDHDNVMMGINTNYGALDPSICVQFTPIHIPYCSALKGLNILLGIAQTGGDFNVPWHVKFVIFTDQGFEDHAYNTYITKLDQINSLQNSGDVTVMDAPITFNCAPVSETTYSLGTPEVIPYP